MPFFSVIVPAYNSATYITKGLDSIRAQTYTDYELIIVCDSCTDNTAQIARKYTDKVYECHCGSAGQSRNIGIDHATGNWILFMDDDDWWLHEYAFEMLAEKLRFNHKDDILAFSFIFKGQGYAKCNKWDAVWNKAWNRDFLNRGNFRFPSTLFFDDTKFSADTLNRAAIQYYDTPLYYYNAGREGSVTERRMNGEFDDKLKRDYYTIYHKEMPECMKT